MRHRIAKRTLNADSEHRRAVIKNLSTELINHEKIETTLAKAKFFRPYLEKLITKAKSTDKSNKLETFNTLKYLRTKINSEEAIKKLVNDLGPRFSNRKGGYTRIVRIGNRSGDNAMMARIELVELKTKKTEDKSKLKSKTAKAKGKQDEQK